MLEKLDPLDSILHKLPNHNSKPKPEQHVLTIRLPESLFQILKEEAKSRDVSINSLAVAKMAIKAEALKKLAEEKEEDVGN